jgi:Sulfotransferase domain
MTIRIAMWSGPRNISTAMMRSFGSRADCAVSDEPFYGAFLKTSGEPQPMASEVIADMDCDWRSVTRTMNGPAPDAKPLWYQKHMPHHMVGPVDVLDFPNHRHAFLIREPELVVASYEAKNELREARLLGFAKLVDYHSRISDLMGTCAPVVDSQDILSDPAGLLQSLCIALDIEWDAAMLAWAPGRHPADGIWARHWYGAVEASSGFAPPKSTQPVLSDDARRIAEECRADYETLASYRLKPHAGVLVDPGARLR